MSSPTVQKTHTTGNHIAYGKVIFFGEHFVVYGVKAIVAAVTEYTSCAITVEPVTPSSPSGLYVEDNRPAVPGYIVEKRAEQQEAHELVLKHLKIDLSNTRLKMVLGGPLVPTSGIGASASDVVAMSRALNEIYGLGLTEEQINQSGYAGECGYHGTPSGIDNTAATFGGLLIYQKTKEGSKFDRLQSKQAGGLLHIVVVSTGITSSTTKVVAAVRQLKEQDEARFEAWLNEYRAIMTTALEAIQCHDIATIGAMMNANHELLQKVTVSCAELDTIVLKARALGAIGAKMSGTGRGGIAVALCESVEQQAIVAQGLESLAEAKYVWKYNVKP